MRSIARIVVCAALVAPTGAFAQQPIPQLSPQWHSCLRTYGGTDDDQIKSCTQIIQSGRQSGHMLAIAFLNRGSGYIQKGDYDRALADDDEAVRIDAQGTRALELRGTLHRLMGHYDLAIADYDRAIGIKPNDDSAFNGRGLAYAEKGDYDRAIADQDEAVRIVRGFDLKPDSLLSERCWMRAIFGRELDRAMADCDEALDISPDTTTLTNRGLVHYKLGAYDRAVADTSEAVADSWFHLGSPASRGATFYIRGVAKLRSSDKTGGESDIAAAKAIDPKIAETYAKYGVVP